MSANRENYEFRENQAANRAKSLFRKMGIQLTQVAATGSVAAPGASGGLSADASGIGGAV